MKTKKEIKEELIKLKEEGLLRKRPSSYFHFPFSKGEVILVEYGEDVYSPYFIIGKHRGKKYPTVWVVWINDPWNPQYCGFLSHKDYIVLMGEAPEEFK